MIKIAHNPYANVIEAAGGLLWRETAAGLELALIHRPSHDDWTLPKGKREDGESWQDTALREVREETGCRAELDSYAGSIGYIADGTPKVVLFWNMHVVEVREFKPNHEVDRLVWLPLEQAIKKMSYAVEIAFLKTYIS